MFYCVPNVIETKKSAEIFFSHLTLVTLGCGWGGRSRWKLITLSSVIFIEPFPKPPESPFWSSSSSWNIGCWEILRAIYGCEWCWIEDGLHPGITPDSLFSPSTPESIYPLPSLFLFTVTEPNSDPGLILHDQGHIPKIPNSYIVLEQELLVRRITLCFFMLL